MTLHEMYSCLVVRSQRDHSLFMVGEGVGEVGGFFRGNHMVFRGDRGGSVVADRLKWEGII